MQQPQAKVVILGGGFSGVGMAVRLKQQGIQDLVVLERAEDLGGTWHSNTYPGCTCDVPSHLYSLSFAPNPDWSHTYSPQAEIRDYLRRVADEFGLRPHLRTNVAFESARWRQEDARWEIETSAGTFTATVLISALGPLTEPMIPHIPGLDGFRGKIMHSARWDHDYELTGKRVASIGTGASAIQYVPKIRPDVEQLYVFQRTAPWIMPHSDRPISDLERSLYRRVPLTQRVVRAAVYASRELLVLGFAKRPRLMRLLEKLSRSHIRKQISDPALRAKVTPGYALGCKRMVPSNLWYPALAESNVELVTAGIKAVREHSIVDGSGAERKIDAIILGTGFHVTDLPVAEHVRGREGKLLSEIWNGSPRAYLGTSVPGFPNLFLLLGPNTGVGHTSLLYMAESQIEHVVQAIQALERSGKSTIEARPEAQARFNRELDARMKGTVWETGGCVSFYLDATGRNAALWPDWTWRFRQRAVRFDAGAYALEARAPAAVIA